MTSFKTNMSEWSGGFAPPSPITAQKSDPWGELAAKLIPGAIEAVGKGYATAKGANLLGTATTAEEALQTVEAFDESVPFTDDPSNTPDQKARIEDMRNQALRKYGTNDKKLQALVSSGKISTLEANARRHQLLQENLSNPVLAMFKDDFMEASAAFTGGPGLTEQFFGAYIPTEEERVQMAMQEKVIAEKAAYEANIENVSQIFGISKDAARVQVQQSAEREQYLANAEAEHKLRGLTSHESYTVAMTHIDDLSGKITAQLGAMVAQGQKFSDPAAIIGQLEQARALGVSKIAPYAANMTQDDRRNAEAELNRRINSLIDMVESADGHEYFKRSIQRVTMSVEANQARNTQKLMDVMGPLWIVHKEAPELASLIHGTMLGDKAAEFGFKADPWAQTIAKGLGIQMNVADLPEVATKIAEGNKEWNVRDAVMAATAFWTGGSQGAKAEVELANTQPDVHTAMLQKAFQNPEVDLSPYATSKEWVVRARTPEGAKTVANGIRARVSSARSRQMRTGDIPSGEIIVRQVPKVTRGLGVHNAYEFHTPGIDKSVQNDMIQVIKIMQNSPLVMKELGVSSPEEYLQKFFLKN